MTTRFDPTQHREIAALTALELARLARRAADIYEAMARTARTDVANDGSYDLADLCEIAGANTQLAKALQALLPLPTLAHGETVQTTGGSDVV